MCGLDKDSNAHLYKDQSLCKRCDKYEHRELYEVKVSDDFPIHIVAECISFSQIYVLFWRNGEGKAVSRIPQRKKEYERFEAAKNELGLIRRKKVRHILNPESKDGRKDGLYFCGADYPGEGEFCKKCMKEYKNYVFREYIKSQKSV
jgi:hypothetical protein